MTVALFVQVHLYDQPGLLILHREHAHINKVLEKEPLEVCLVWASVAHKKVVDAKRP